MNNNQTPSEIIKANVEQVANTLRDYNLPMMTQLELVECVENIIQAARREGEAGYNRGVRIMRDPTVEATEKSAVAAISV